MMVSSRSPRRTSRSPDRDDKAEPPSAITILEYVLWLLCTCISLSPKALTNPVFALVLYAEKVIEQFMLDASITFAPNLLEVLESATPPSTTYFKSLPAFSQTHKVWGVYLLVLEKSGFRPKIYIGSGTCRTRGIHARFSQYDSLDLLPIYVQKAIDSGYTIVHKGLLCWAPLPTAMQRYPFRVLFLALEATFSWAFWAMYSRKWVFMHSLCRWPIESLGYDGCCSHSSMSEKVAGETGNLTPEQIEAAEAQRLQAAKDYQAAYYLKQKELNPDGWLAGRRKSEKTYQAKVLATGKYSCTPCDRVFASSKDQRRHEASDIHIANVAGVRKTVIHTGAQARHADNKALKRYYCSTCDKSFVTQQKKNQHMAGKRHAKKAASGRSVRTIA